MSHRFAPVTSEISMGATLPRKTEARKEDTREMRAVALYASGYLSWNRRIWGPLKRFMVLVSTEAGEGRAWEKTKSLHGEHCFQ
jgi:hypothetical protein